VLERRQRALGEDHPDTVAAVSSLAGTLYSLGEHERARRMGEDVLERRRRVLGDNHPDTLVSIVNLAMSLAALKQKIPARRMAEHGFRGLRTALGNQHDLTQWARDRLNEIAASMGGIGRTKSSRRR
ncbi:tetratricopeptide repeat protein, partial [Micromonospora chokoriensis]